MAKKKKKKRGRQLFASPESALKHPSWPGRCQPTEKDNHFDTCPNVMTSHPVRTAGGQQMFCVICYLPRVLSKNICRLAKNVVMERWIDGHMKAVIKVKEGFFQCIHGNGICLAEWGYLFILLSGLQMCECTNKWDLFSKWHLRGTIINIGHLWFYAVFQTRLGYQKCLLFRIHITQGMCASQNPLK